MNKQTRKESVDYWHSLESETKDSRTRDPYALGIVCHPGLPLFVNRYFDFFQRRALQISIDSLELNLSRKRCLDIGCGGGRISNIWRKLGADVTGIDIQRITIEQNRKLFPGIKFEVMSALELDFPVGSFDFVSSVTVLQHMPADDQKEVLRDIARILQPGAELLLLESIIDRGDPHMFPMRPHEWVDIVQGLGFKLEYSRAVGYDPIIRLLNVVLHKARVTLIRGGERNSASGWKARPRGHAQALRGAAFSAAVIPSYPLEFVCEGILPATLANHCLMVFRRT